MKPEELSAEQKTELTDKQLEAASGGTSGDSPIAFTCPKCGSTNVATVNYGDYLSVTCKDCGYEWYVPFYPN